MWPYRADRKPLVHRQPLQQRHLCVVLVGCRFVSLCMETLLVVMPKARLAASVPFLETLTLHSALTFLHCTWEPYHSCPTGLCLYVSVVESCARSDFKEEFERLVTSASDGQSRTFLYTLLSLKLRVWKTATRLLSSASGGQKQCSCVNRKLIQKWI